MTLLFLFLPLSLFFFACEQPEQPFRAGLGSVVDIRPPTVVMTEPGVGSTIYGKRTFKGTAEDDYKIDRVELMVTNYPNLDDNEWKEWTKVALKINKQNKVDWSIPIDTTIFPDGYLKVQVRVFDSVRTEPAVTDEYVFTVLNDLPKIKLLSPLILEDEGGGDGVIAPYIRDPRLNYGSNIDNETGDLPSAITYKRQVEPRSTIAGSIVYETGIYTEGRVIENGAVRYPPQFRLWPINNSPIAGEARLDGWPSETDVPWVDFEADEKSSLLDLGNGRYSFSTKVPETAGFYGFEVRAQSADGRVSFHYPRDFWINDLQGYDWDNQSPPSSKDEIFITENRYVLVYIRTTEEPTLVKFWDLQDIMGDQHAPPANYNTGSKTYANLAFGADVPHPYVDDIRVNKNGDFKVRVNASHSQGIQGALAFWESDNNGRGVFIWDPADENPQNYATWSPDNNVSRDEPFSNWGYLDPHDPGKSQRNFIFTYNHANPTGNVWKYTGSSNWDAVREQIAGATIGGDDDLSTFSSWEKVTGKLWEDTYSIIVYAFSTTGSPGMPKETRYVRLDFTPPKIEINTIEGAYSTNLTAGTLSNPISDPAYDPHKAVSPFSAVVNGVIKPSVRISDSLGIREAVNPATTAYYKGTEQRYVLVNNASKGAMDTLIARTGSSTEGWKTNYWPPIPTGNPNTSTASTTIEGGTVTVWRHGAIYSDSSTRDFTMFKTSELYTTTVGTVLPDNADYWLYVFARDRAFNIGTMEPVKINVQASTDIPTVTFGGDIKTGVTNANYSADGTAAGFYDTPAPTPPAVDNRQPRNRLGLSTPLSVTLRDDDSLDLGTAGAAGAQSSVKIKIAGTDYDAGTGTTIPTITVGTEYTVPDITATNPVTTPVRNIFAPQSSGSLGGRQAVFTRIGEINQNALVRALTNNPSSDVSSLPDGIYRITLEVEEYGPAKLEVPNVPPNVTGETGTKDIKKGTQQIWVFVDTTPPSLSVDGWGAPTIALNPQPISGGGLITTGITIGGTISDRNGPVAITEFTVTDSLRQPVANTAAGTVTHTRVSNTSEYTATFSAPLYVASSVSANLIVTLTAKDRFGRTTTVEQRYNIDGQAPTVTLRTPIAVLDRDDANRVTIPSPNNTQENRKRLVNGVVSFDISATDALGTVAEVRYWLIPSGTTFGGWGNAHGLAANAATAAGGKYGVFDLTTPPLTSSFSRTVYVDTTKLTNNSAYTLYVMARDNANNISSSTAFTAPLPQTVFVRQEEDTPWIMSNTLSGAVGPNSMRASIMINDDDGFYAAGGSGVMTNRVRIWLSGNGSIPATSTDVSDAHMGTGTGGFNYWGPYEVPNSSITPLGSKNISLNINFPDIAMFAGTNERPGLNAQGRIHYIVEVTDSWYGKYINEGANGGAPALVAEGTAGTAADQSDTGLRHLRFQREHYSFVFDSKDPIMRIISTVPAPNSSNNITIGPNNVGTFTVTAAMSDANLKKNAAGNYIIGINRNSQDMHVPTPPANSPLTPFVLIVPNTSAAVTTVNNQDANDNAVTGDTRVNFTIANSALLTAIGYTALPEGRNTLVLMAEDESGKRGSSASLVFFKDTTPPSFTFTGGFNDAKTQMPKINGSEWWAKIANIGATTAPNMWSDADRTSYQTARASLPVIKYEPLPAGSTYPEDSLPAITGTFKDDYSNIARTANTFKIKWDNVETEHIIPVSQLGDDGKNVSWKVYLTANGTSAGAGTPSNLILADGAHSIRITIADAAGNVLSYDADDDGTEDQYGFRIVSSTPAARLTHVNNTTPITNPSIQKVYGDRYGALTTSVFTLRGEGTSANLSDVRIRIRNTDSNSYHAFERSVRTPNTEQIPDDANAANPLTWTYTANSDKLEWAMTIPRSYIMYAGNIPLLTTAGNTIRPGNYEVLVIAVDSAGKLSEETTENIWTFTVDSAPPTFSFNMQSDSGDKAGTRADRGPAHWVTNATTKAARNVLTGTLAEDTLAIRGRVSDAGSNLDAVDIQLTKWDYNGGTNNAGAWTIYDFSANTFTGSENAANSWRSLLATPGAGSSEYVVNWLFTGVAPALLTDGYYSIRLRAKDVSKADGGTTGWGTTLGGAAADNGNPIDSHYVYFFIDTKNPTFNATIPAEPTLYSSRYASFNTANEPTYQLTFNISVEDPNMFESLTASVERINTTEGTTPALVTVGTPKRSGTGAWTASATIAFRPREVVPANAAGTGDTTGIGSRPLTGNASTGLPDGAYRIVFTAVDLAGKTGRETRTITLDNRPPTGSITEPRFRGNVTQGSYTHRFGSETKIGGESFEITGTTNDLGENGSASMPKEMWYRIGYGSKTIAQLQSLLTGTETAAQRSAKIAAWVINSGDGLPTTLTYDRGALDDGVFNAAAQGTTTANSLWFKYTTTNATYDKPTAFDAIPANPDLLAWSLTAGQDGSAWVSTNYAVGSLPLRGRTYTNGANGSQYLAREIPSTQLPADLRMGLFSLPLVIRVVDNAGNVFYELRDIWLYPNGDNPNSNILNPADRFTSYTAPRGGQFNIDGVASDNKSVRTVIYRVKVDNTRHNTATGGAPPADNGTAFTATSPTANTNNQIQTGTRFFTYANHGLIVGDTVVTGTGANAARRYVLWVGGTNNSDFKLSNTYTWPTTAVWSPAAGNQTVALSNIVTIPGAAKWESHNEYGTTTTGMLGKWNEYNNPGVTEANSGTNLLSKDGWYLANLESTPYDSTMPWSFMLNAGGEISRLIPLKGFSEPSGGANNMIRVWVETLVFDGTTAVANSPYNRMSLGLDNPNANNPRPYVREFYLTASAPTITTPQITTLGSTTAFGSYGPALAENYVRSGNFAVRATVNSSGSQNINEISVRLRGETNGGWQPAYVRTDATPVKTLTGLGLGGWTGGTPGNANARTATLTYTFNSTAVSSTTQQTVRGGLWAKSGGTFTVDVRVRDNANPPAEAVYTFEIGVDNFIPIADTQKNTTNTKVAGSNVQFQGRVFDYEGSPNAEPPKPPHRKIKEIRVWFTNRANTQYINMSTGRPIAQASVGRTNTTGIYTSPQADITWGSTTATANNVDNIVLSGTPAAAAYYIPTATNYVRVITESAGGTWSPSTGGADIYWSFIQDTTNMDDGWMKMHYVVYDQADNRSYYVQDMIVMNNYPRITNVTLYTNNTGEGAVFTTHTGNDAYSEYPIAETPDPSGYLNSGFISKNNVIGFGVDTVKGNAPLTYEVRHVERYLVPLNKTNLTAMASAPAADGTRQLAHLANTVTLDANGVPNATATTSEGGFLDFYTIATGNSGRITGGAPVWRLLGVPPLTNPVDGTHFVFQAINVAPADPPDPRFNNDDNVYNMAGFPNAYVYAYKQVGAVTKTFTPPTNAPNKVEPGDLNFSGSTYFGTTNTTIKKAQATAVRNATTADAAGTAYFLIKVWDTVDNNVDRVTTGLTSKDMLYDAVVVGMKVYVGDTDPPFARLYDLNPYLEEAVQGGNSTGTFQQRTLNDAADPKEIGENIKRGGLYNLGTERAPIKSGYIEPRFGTNAAGGSTALNPYVNYPSSATAPWPLGSRQEQPKGFVAGDAVGTNTTASPDKVSGTVILRGIAWDDQLINTISVKIGSDPETVILHLKYVYPDGTVWVSPADPPVDPLPAEIIALELARKMVPVAAGKAWAYEEISWQTGHTVEWAYLWDTEKEPAAVSGTNRSTRGGYAAGQTIRVIVKDFNGNNKAGLPNAARTVNGAGNVTTTQIPGVTAVTPPADFHNAINVDIVPYITSLQRADRFATKRSRYGWYSFFQGEGGTTASDIARDGIRAVGYNLSTTAAAVTLASSNAAGGTALTSGTYAANNNSPNTGHTFSIGANSASGRINITAGGRAVWNHDSLHANKSWNRENFTYVTGSNLWTNKLFAHIWRSTESSAAPATYFGNNSSSGGSWDAENPSMALEYGTTDGTGGDGDIPAQTTGDGGVPGRLHGVWGHRSTFKTFYAANDIGSGIRLQEAQDPQAFTDLAYYPGTNNANNLTAVYVYQWDALPNLLIRTHMRYLADGSSALGLNPGGTITPFLIRRDNRNIPTDTKRWQNVRTSMAAVNLNGTSDPNYSPHVGDTTGGNNEPETQNGSASRGNAGRVYTAGYDAVGKNLFFVERAGFNNYGITNEGSRGNQVARLPLFIDGQNAATGVNNNNTWGNVGSGAAGASTSARAGNWSAVDYVTDGGSGSTIVPVIAYYDEANDTLRLAYGSVNGTGTDGANGTAARWTRRYVLDSNDKLFAGSGKYVSMKVDKANNIHLAFYNSNHQTVVYAVGTRTGAFTSYAVDNIITGGIWTDISVDNNGNPWITYGDSGRIPTNPDGVRIAYKDTTAFSRALTDPITGRSITGWESVTMPADYTIAEDRLNIEVWPPTDRRSTAAITANPLTSAANGGSPVSTIGWHAAVGYAGTGGTTKQFRIGYFYKPTFNDPQ